MFGHNIIITERVSALRQLGRNALRGKWATAIIATMIYLLALNLPVAILDRFFGYNPANIMVTEGNTYGVDPQVYAELYNNLPKASILSWIYVLLIGGAFALGICLFYLASFRGHKVVSTDIFLGFEKFGKALGLFLYKYLFVVLWSLLFVIPGIIAMIRYSQAFYILADDPEKSIRQCMDESKMMMRGNKAKYFLMDLSFIGWAILSSIPAGILNGIVNQFADNTVALIAGAVISSLFLAPVYSYIFSTQAGFYEILSGHLIKETAPAPVTPEQIAIDAPDEAIEEVLEDMGEVPRTEDTPAATEDTSAQDETSAEDIQGKE